MSADYPVVGPGGGIQLAAVVGTDGELHLVIGRPDEPGVAELMVAITKLADMATLYGERPARVLARRELEAAIQALHLAGLVAA